MTNEQTIVTAPDIVCNGCVNAIKNALGRVDGISNVEVDVETKRVNVDHASSISREGIVKALDDAGFPAS